MTVIEQLKTIQKRENLSDGEFATKLGIHIGSWNRLKNGKSRLDIKTIRNALKAYPELSKSAINWLYGDNNYTLTDSKEQ